MKHQVLLGQLQTREMPVSGRWLWQHKLDFRRIRPMEDRFMDYGTSSSSESPFCLADIARNALSMMVTNATRLVCHSCPSLIWCFGQFPSQVDRSPLQSGRKIGGLSYRPPSLRWWYKTGQLVKGVQSVRSTVRPSLWKLKRGLLSSNDSVRGASWLLTTTQISLALSYPATEICCQNKNSATVTLKATSSSTALWAAAPPDCWALPDVSRSDSTRWGWLRQRRGWEEPGKISSERTMRPKRNKLIPRWMRLVYTPREGREGQREVRRFNERPADGRSRQNFGEPNNGRWENALSVWQGASQDPSKS